jgi:hypothetical protein
MHELAWLLALVALHRLPNPRLAVQTQAPNDAVHGRPAETGDGRNTIWSPLPLLPQLGYGALVLKGQASR